jgi:hypothetical protein
VLFGRNFGPLATLAKDRTADKEAGQKGIGYRDFPHLLLVLSLLKQIRETIIELLSCYSLPDTRLWFYYKQINKAKFIHESQHAFSFLCL